MVAKDAGGRKSETIEIYAEYRQPAAWVQYGDKFYLVEWGLRAIAGGVYAGGINATEGLMAITNVDLPEGAKGVPQPSESWATKNGVIELDGQTVVMSIVRDIAECRSAEGALRESEIKFRGIFDAANDGIQFHDVLEDGSPGQFIDVNDVACRMVGYTRNEMLTMSPLEDSHRLQHNRPLPEILRELGPGTCHLRDRAPEERRDHRSRSRSMRTPSFTRVRSG